MSMRQISSQPSVASEPARKEYLFKILVIGDVGTGKSSIIRRYVHNLFNHLYKATIGVDFALKIVLWDMDTLIRLQIWDISVNVELKGKD
ncbi:hypothetical protein QR680_015323 [Steinernema hermaphroditum]|uniref:Ras-related protein Rab n=1 Tax=Steinernema hermaphroditum TaxID=289476 RepID=A0AA39H7A5_9BILA|nr:hypothetical protein QR680_015323 [Steinernema hermaphroditum]